MQAIILAAGSGLRLRDIHTLPKGFLKMGNTCLIEQSIQHLTHHGMSDVLMITGYGCEHYEQWAQNYPSVALQHNPFFQTYSSLYSLYLAKDWVSEDVLILESDIFYEGRALTSLIDAPYPDALVTSGFTYSGDEVYVSAEDNYLVTMSKNRHAHVDHDILGEFVGLTKLSRSSFQHFMTRIEHNLHLLHQGHYDEHGLVDLISTCPLRCIHMPDLLWSEIDNLDHFIRAKDVYAKIQSKEIA